MCVCDLRRVEESPSTGQTEAQQSTRAPRERSNPVTAVTPLDAVTAVTPLDAVTAITPLDAFTAVTRLTPFDLARGGHGGPHRP